VITPCQRTPDGYLQPGEDDDWHLLPSTRAAINACHRTCPIALEDCARQALSAGTRIGSKVVTVASGVIHAGIVCRGDAETRRALTEVAYPDGDAPEWVDVNPEDEECAVCSRSFVPDEDPTTNTTAHRAVDARPLCWSCYAIASREGALTPIRQIPDACQGECGRPMVRKVRRKGVPFICPPGSVVHEAGGKCGACIRAERRSAGEQVAA
jgi:hypothetical protein